MRKIVNQARRTRDLVANLLSFAQQVAGRKAPRRLEHAAAPRHARCWSRGYAGGKIHVTVSIEPDFPHVQGNANQLFQAFIEIIENAMDALEEAGGGSLEITAATPRRRSRAAVFRHRSRNPRAATASSIPSTPPSPSAKAPAWA